jgi:hypothetical protein
MKSTLIAMDDSSNQIVHEAIKQAKSAGILNRSPQPKAKPSIQPIERSETAAIDM